MNTKELARIRVAIVWHIKLPSPSIICFYFLPGGTIFLLKWSFDRLSSFLTFFCTHKGIGITGKITVSPCDAPYKTTEYICALWYGYGSFLFHWSQCHSATSCMVVKHSEKLPSVGGGQLIFMSIITTQDEGYYK